MGETQKSLSQSAKIFKLDLHQVQGAGALDLASDLTMLLRGDASCAAWVDLTGLGREFTQEIRIEIADAFRWDVVTATRHLAIRAAHVHRSFFGLWACHVISW